LIRSASLPTWCAGRGGRYREHVPITLILLSAARS
jgi:hypothetical protein